MRMIMVLTLFTAFVTLLPRYFSLSPSLNSTASYIPVDAPDGTAALPTMPLSKITSTSTVGLPLESSISLPFISFIFPIISTSNNYYTLFLGACQYHKAIKLNNFQEK